MPVLQNSVTMAITQSQVTPFTAAYRLAKANVSQQSEVAWGLPPPPPLPAYQPRNMGDKG